MLRQSGTVSVDIMLCSSESALLKSRHLNTFLFNICLNPSHAPLKLSSKPLQKYNDDDDDDDIIQIENRTRKRSRKKYFARTNSGLSWPSPVTVTHIHTDRHTRLY